ncbi:DNA-binding protein [Photorhabdus caribbeanensis]|uniref:DNA-binding protein n=1 Tax=Photorhabdus caribbeanensis TaxID=1004165 RepID=UPI001BD6B69D|nr:DNA-binding protein [Photorhabdus caribbeanensis]MBS9423149.1 DNA-binding protein [Photorhabdus caribbeanensis]
MNTATKQRNLNELQVLLQKRFDIIFDSLMPEFAEKAKASNALVLPDSELFGLLYSTVLEKSARTPDRELRKLKRRAENLSNFYKEIERMGGVIKAVDVADILGITRQAVNLRVKGNKLLAFKKNSDHVFPLFQFKEGGLLPHFEDVMKAMSNDIGPVSRISFLTTPLSDKNGKGKTPIEIMKEDSSIDDVSKMLRAAKQMGEQIAS